MSDLGYTVPDLVRRYGRSEQTWRRLVDSGVVPVARVGHYRLVRPEHLPALVAEAQRRGYLTEEATCGAA